MPAQHPEQRRRTVTVEGRQFWDHLIRREHFMKQDSSARHGWVLLDTVVEGEPSRCAVRHSVVFLLWYVLKGVTVGKEDGDTVGYIRFSVPSLDTVFKIRLPVKVEAIRDAQDEEDPDKRIALLLKAVPKRGIPWRIRLADAFYEAPMQHDTRTPEQKEADKARLAAEAAARAARGEEPHTRGPSARRKTFLALQARWEDEDVLVNAG